MTRVNAGLRLGGGFLDAHFRDPLIDRRRHPAELVDLSEVDAGALDQLVGQFLDKVRPTPGVDRRAGVVCC